ncbi:MAG: nitroreductase family protein [Cyanobacteria bacterium]|nr:nitroreductase family protein [Cyanobacteriota bacterium]
MNEVLEVIKKRRSIRKFIDKPVEEEKIKKIIEAARFAPSATNKQPWRFIMVTNKELISKIAENCLGFINRYASTAPLLVIGCSARKRSVVQKLADKIIGVDFGIVDVSIALEHMVLEAQELGLASCWIGWFNEGKLKHIIKEINPQWSVIAVLAIGYHDKSYIPRERKLLPEEEVIIRKN